jgi:putative phosphoesterase
MLRPKVRIALFSDVHGNAAALRAVFRAIDRLEPDRIFALGDIVGRGPEPNECVRILKKRGVLFVRGNWDEWVAGVPGWETRAKRRAHVEAARRLMGAAEIEHLLEGPATRKISIAGVTLFMAHGSPRNPVELLGPETSEEQLREAIEPAEDAGVIALGHSHRPFVREIDERLVLNTGTVGYPFDGDPRASFALLEIEDGRPHAEIVRVPYPLGKNLRALDRAVDAGAIPAQLAHRYRRALLGEGDALETPAQRDECGGEALLRLIAPAVRRAYGGEATPDTLHALLRAADIAMPALHAKRARPARESLVDELTRREHLGFVESLARRADYEDAPVLASLARLRARRWTKRLDDLYPADRRIRLGLVWLELAMLPRDHSASIAELLQQAKEPVIEKVDVRAWSEIWAKRARDDGEDKVRAIFASFGGSGAE